MINCSRKRAWLAFLSKELELAKEEAAREKLAKIKQKSRNNSIEAELDLRLRKARDQMIRDSINYADYNSYSYPKPVKIKTPPLPNLTKRVSHESKGVPNRGDPSKTSNEDQSRVHPMHRKLFPPSPPGLTKPQNPAQAGTPFKGQPGAQTPHAK